MSATASISQPFAATLIVTGRGPDLGRIFDRRFESFRVDFDASAFGSDALELTTDRIVASDQIEHRGMGRQNTVAAQRLAEWNQSIIFTDRKIGRFNGSKFHSSLLSL